MTSHLSLTSNLTEYETLWLQQILKTWRKLTRRMVRDRKLFFALRNFIVKRLTSKVVRGMKIAVGRKRVGGEVEGMVKRRI